MNRERREKERRTIGENKRRENKRPKERGRKKRETTGWNNKWEKKNGRRNWIGAREAEVGMEGGCREREEGRKMKESCERAREKKVANSWPLRPFPICCALLISNSFGRNWWVFGKAARLTSWYDPYGFTKSSIFTLFIDCYFIFPVSIAFNIIVITSHTIPTVDPLSSLHFIDINSHDQGLKRRMRIVAVNGTKARTQKVLSIRLTKKGIDDDERWQWRVVLS